ncbi:MAG: glycoside hydrolase family 32 protein [Selenomonadaceae bacterium]|nr:glycoside hydrolase family 32 protein [Selenomonadaceae bacterium]
MAKKTGERVEDLKGKFNKQEVDARIRESIPFKHPWHNRFHVDPAYSLISDPNGLTFCDGKFHIFAQWNPIPQNRNWHKSKSWYHTTTTDFVNYTMPELSMWPTDVYDKDGCYSGCGFVEDGKVRVFYTCNARDDNYMRKVTQRFGTLQDDGSISKDEIIVATQPEGYTSHFRDPNLFYRDGKRYFVIAAQRLNDPEKKESSRPTNGTALVYKETDTKDNFELLGEIKTDYYDFGYMWECPNFVQFDEADALIMCPQGVPHEPFRFHNYCLCGYIAGHLSLDTMEMTHGEFQELDRGFDFYSPQILYHEGRKILIGWMGMPELVNEMASADLPDEDNPWLYSLTMPRELSFKNGHIYCNPIKEFEALRGDCKVVDEENKQNIAIDLPDGSESNLTLKFGDAEKVSLVLAYGEEKLTFNYNKTTQIMFIDRNGMNLGGKGTRKFKLATDGELQFRLFVDRSAIEIYLQDGEEVAGMFVFPEKVFVPKFTIEADAPIAKVCGNVWAMGQFNYK